MVGQIIRIHGGFAFVRDPDTGKVWTALRRGKLAEEKILVGDLVEFSPLDEERGVLEKVLPRKTELYRPPVANVEQALLVFAFTEPDPNFKLLDRFLVLSQSAKIKPIICFNKLDLASPGLYQEERRAYEEAGFVFLAVSAKTGQGLEELKRHLSHRVTVLAGPSGVGKSSLLNAIQPGLKLQTAPVSRKTGRGRHTTRLVELLPLDIGGLVVDTPGFTSLDLPDIPPASLSAYFPEIARVGAGCRFSDCLHQAEPGCAVREAVAEGKIPRFRYQHYLVFLGEILERERRKFS
ncbi:ribosome small subunit-dependent GTPase A [Ammonifex degensii KC4]|uniref:Small ribosomal subunit biogenesis GTPase RsgA n=1 Tax=Ammonifex degensii (strain DSM 10501 / KC4) TaxID=429009 RepID=C9R7Y8_AMMDK|nr:ribosome small subunit-dependent GTPase A [Ammonifex degensii]ACX52417.1 ribosome small subunit-dependent GTPase A [Ammonifex degensii KC4]